MYVPTPSKEGSPIAKRRDPNPAGPRVPLTKDRVLRAAMDLADQHGIESLSMRRLGQALGVEAMSLYNHVANKGDILDGIVDLVVSEIDVPASDPDWKAAMRRSAISAHEALRRHPWANAVMISAGVRSARLRYMESILRRLREAGFSPEMTHHAYHALDSHIVGFALWEAGYAALPDDLSDLAAAFLREVPAAEYPYLVEHVEQHLADSGDADVSEFEFGLDLILDGLERIRARA